MRGATAASEASGQRLDVVELLRRYQVQTHADLVQRIGTLTAALGNVRERMAGLEGKIRGFTAGTAAAAAWSERRAGLGAR